tara:strand:- start:37 stop:654 length:618 start_codon:yes stop_codon:yes gene_type:complete
MKNDEKLSVFNNIGEYEAYLSIEGKKVSINLTKELPRVRCQNRVCIAVSVINMKLMDMIIQKSVELGATDFYPVYTKRSQYKNVDKKVDHWNKIIISATEQCGRFMMMKIHEPLNLEAFINQHDNKACYLLNPKGDKFSSNDFYQNDITVFIGPEGGFEDNELISFKQNNWKTRSINGNILRTETACISVLTLIENYDSISRHSL